MAAKRSSSDDDDREHRKRPAEGDKSGQSEAKVPRLLSEDEKGEGTRGTAPEQEHAGPATKRSNDSSDKQASKADPLSGESEPRKRRVDGESEDDGDAETSEAAKESDETDSKDTGNKDTDDKSTDKKDDSKDTDRKDTESKDADSNDKQSADETDGESEPKKRKVAGENEDDQGTEEDVGSAEEGAETKRGEKEDDEKRKGGEENNNAAEKESEEESEDEDEYNPFANIILVMEEDENGELHLVDVLIDSDEDEEDEKSEDDETEDDTEDETEEAELIAAFAALFGLEEEEKVPADQPASEEADRQSSREGADTEGENKKEDGLKTEDERREDEKNEATEEQVKSGKDVEEDAEVEEDGNDREDPVTLHVIFNKQNYDVELPLSARMSRLKKAITEKTGIEPSMQKLCYKGATQVDEKKSLRDAGLSANSKILLVGSTARDINAVLPPKPAKGSQTSPLLKRQPFCKLAPWLLLLRARRIHLSVGVCNGFAQRHKAIIDDGVPDDAYPGIANVHEDLPNGPITGMLNSQKQKIRLTLRLEEDQFWISTKETTEKYSMSKVLTVVSQPIEGHEEYHIMCIVTGMFSEVMWLYWVPAQFVRAIKKTILGRG